MNATNECLEFYKEMLEIQNKFLLEFYVKMFKSLSNEKIIDLCKIYTIVSNEKRYEYVYFMYNEATELIKIGRSNNPKQRLYSINSVFKTQFGMENKISLIGIICVPSGNSTLLEQKLHDKFKEYNKNGEWFELTKEQIYELLKTNSFKKIVDDYHTYYIYDEDINVGFEFEVPKETELFTFSLDTLDSYTIKISNNNLDMATLIKKYIHTNLCNGLPNNFLGFDMRNINAPFSYETSNKSWEIFKWLFINNYI